MILENLNTYFFFKTMYLENVHCLLVVWLEPLVPARSDAPLDEWDFPTTQDFQKQIKTLPSCKVNHNRPKQRLKRKRSKDSENDDRPKKRSRSDDDFMLDSADELLRSDDEMQVKPKPKRKLKRKRQLDQKPKPKLKKPKQEKPARKKSQV